MLFLRQQRLKTDMEFKTYQDSSSQLKCDEHALKLICMARDYNVKYLY